LERIAAPRDFDSAYVGLGSGAAINSGLNRVRCTLNQCHPQLRPASHLERDIVGVRMVGAFGFGFACSSFGRNAKLM